MEFLLIGIIVCLGMTLLIIAELKLENQKLRSQLYKEQRDLKHFSDRVRTFLRAICNQQEKAQSALQTVVKLAYKKEIEDNQRYIFKRVKERIGL